MFLFYGWFKRVLPGSEKLTYRSDDPGRHVIFGWLQIDFRVASKDAPRLLEWAYQHPHYGRTEYGENDSIYVSTPYLSSGGKAPDVAGGGLFLRFDDDLCLSAPDQPKSVWQLPAWFNKGDGPKLTYHPQPKWSPKGDHVLLQTRSPGQEFVLDCDYYPEARDWAIDLIKHHS
jgi:hypothetical protein